MKIRNNMILRKYIPKDADTIVKWIKDERSFRYWCADRYPNFPISADDINCYYRIFGEDMHIFTAIDASCQPAAAHDAVAQNGLGGIGGAGGSEAAGRRQEWRNAALIQANRQDADPADDTGHGA